MSLDYIAQALADHRLVFDEHHSNWLFHEILSAPSPLIGNQTWLVSP